MSPIALLPPYYFRNLIEFITFGSLFNSPYDDCKNHLIRKKFK
jgi:hypothetical protein